MWKNSEKIYVNIYIYIYIYIPTHVEKLIIHVDNKKIKS
jgi:hypothetical protein